MDDLTTHTSLSPIRRGFAPGFVDYKKGCTRLAAASDKVYQLLAHGRWFSPGTPASSTTKTGRHDISEILLKVALNTINQIQLNPLNYIANIHMEQSVRITIFNATLNNVSVISWGSVLLVEEIGVPGEKPQTFRK